MDTTEIQRIIADYCEQLYTNRFENLQEIDKFLTQLRVSSCGTTPTPNIPSMGLVPLLSLPSLCRLPYESTVHTVTNYLIVVFSPH